MVYSTPKKTLEKLEAEYKKNFPGKIELFQSLMDALHHSFQEETLLALRIEVHKMAGSAGSFGFPEVSVICKEFERDIIQKIKELPSSGENSQWILDFDSYLKKIKDAFIIGNSRIK